MTEKTSKLSRRGFMTRGATVAVGAGALAAPPTIASASQPITMRIQTHWAPGAWHYDAVFVDLTNRIRIATDGEINLEPHPPESIVGTLDKLTAAGRGTIDAAFTFPAYWVGQVPSAGHLNGNLATFSSLQDMEYFFYETEALSIIQDAYAERGVHVVGPISAGGVTLFGKRPLQTLADFRGHRIRTTGNAARVFERMGAAPAMITGGELFQALQTGVVDAAHWGSISGGLTMGFEEVTSYIMQPDLVYPTNLEVFFNKRRWDSLGENHKQIINDAVRVTSGINNAKILYQDISGMNRFVEEHGGAVVNMDDEVMELMRVASMEIVDEISARDPRYSGRIGQLLHEFMRFTGKL